MPQAALVRQLRMIPFYLLLFGEAAVGPVPSFVPHASLCVLHPGLRTHFLLDINSTYNFSWDDGTFLNVKPRVTVCTVRLCVYNRTFQQHLKRKIPGIDRE